ncbi:MAG: hypothetical protein EPN61_17875 [Burkholderiaceae bacterium]|nr:MAG: hypothetical protein EPN61_17875 [Burkholderiaceae bacterium]
MIGAGKPMACVDLSSGPRLCERIHRHFDDSLVHDCQAGSTASHEFLDPAHAVHLPGSKPVMHMPFDRILKRNKDWGPEETARRLAQAQTDLARPRAEITCCVRRPHLPAAANPRDDRG